MRHSKPLAAFRRAELRRPSLVEDPLVAPEDLLRTVLADFGVRRARKHVLPGTEPYNALIHEIRLRDDSRITASRTGTRALQYSAAFAWRHATRKRAIKGRFRSLKSLKLIER